jgi:hypothetical protein
MSNAYKTDRLVCGCPAGQPDHAHGCQLGVAEQIAEEAAAHRSCIGGGHPMLAAFAALDEAGLLHQVEDRAAEECLLGLLDMLWEAEVLRPRVATATVDEANGGVAK